MTSCRVRAIWTAASIASLLVLGCASSPSQFEIGLPAPYTERGISVAVEGLWKNGYGTVVGISGVATNISGEDLQLCQVTFDVLDAAGVKVSSAVAATNGLKTGQSWRFQATLTNPYVVSFQSVAAGPITSIPSKGLTFGKKFDPTAVDRLHPGASTVSDATRVLGPPSAESSFPNGSRLLQWQFIEGSKGAHLAILFDSNAVMIRITQRFQQGF